MLSFAARFGACVFLRYFFFFFFFFLCLASCDFFCKSKFFRRATGKNVRMGFHLCQLQPFFSGFGTIERNGKLYSKTRLGGCGSFFVLFYFIFILFFFTLGDICFRFFYFMGPCFVLFKMVLLIFFSPFSFLHLSLSWVTKLKGCRRGVGAV
ncbi:hypothetical protein BDZ91DRAFT_241543 [Kalaharituber pfeilii]|nr:hypothetical protein BDZ91DRAFT_241543 [Kalaharituber pfeilii]